MQQVEMVAVGKKDENDITYHGDRNRQPIWNRNQTVGAGG